MPLGKASKILGILLVFGMFAGSATAFAGGSGTQSDPYEIQTCQQLQDMNTDLSAYYELTSDVDCSGTETWNSGNGFAPVGIDFRDTFSGNFDGNGYNIDSLYIDRPGENDNGLFGYLDDSGSIGNFSVTNSNITGDSQTGIASGRSTGTVENVMVDGKVTGGAQTGGAVGFVVKGSINNVYSYADVYGGLESGGLVGEQNSGSISNSFSTGFVELGTDTGGFIGYDTGGTVSDSYWNTETSNFSTSEGGTGLTTSQMTGDSASNNMAFDYSSTWSEVLASDSDTLSSGYPILQNIDRQTQLETQGIYSSGATTGSPSFSWGLTPNGNAYDLEGVNGKLYVAERYSGVGRIDIASQSWDWQQDLGSRSADIDIAGDKIHIARRYNQYTQFDIPSQSKDFDVSLPDASAVGVDYYDGYAYVAADNGYLYAIDNSTQSIEWNKSIGTALTDVKVQDGTAYVTSGDEGSSFVGGFYAVDTQTQTTEWSTLTNKVALSVHLENGLGYVGTDSSIEAVSLSNGLNQWSDSSYTGVREIDAENGNLFFASSSSWVNYDAVEQQEIFAQTESNTVRSIYKGSQYVFVGVEYGDVRAYEIQTQTPPSVSTDAATNVAATSADLNGELTDLGTFSSSDTFFQFRTTGSSTWTNTSKTTQSSTTTFSETVSGLSGSTQYEFRAAADYTEGTVYGSTLTFTTAAANQAPTASFTSNSPVLTSEDFGLDASGSSDSDGTIQTYEWDLDDDGNYDDATGTIPSYSEAEDGTYSISLRVTDDDGATDTTTNDVVVENRVPTADFDYSPTSPKIGESISFDGTLSSDSDGSISTYEWDWTSDGTYEGTGSNPSHSYGSPGSYDVTLRVTDNDGATDTYNETVSVTDQTNPVIDSASPADNTVFNTQTITIDGSFSDNYELSSYTLDIDTSQVDSGSLTGTSDTVSYNTGTLSYGTHTYTWTIEDSAGNTDTLQRTFEVNEPPTASATASPDPASLGETITLDGTGSTDDGTISTYEWDTDNDGTYEVTGDTTTVSESSPGDYTYTLKVTDDDGGTDTDSVTVTVEDQTNPSVANLAPTGRITTNSPSITADLSDNYQLKNWTLDFDGNYEASASLSGTTGSIDYEVGGLNDGQTYSYTLTVEDTAGNTETQTETFTVNDAPVASYTYTPNNPGIGETVSFDASGSSDDDGISSYEWDFGDDGTIEATGQTTTNTYNSQGDYSVTLIVTDTDGETSTTTQTVNVDDQTPPIISNGQVIDQDDGNGIVSDLQGVEISVEVTDNAGVDSVTADLFGNTYTLTDGNGDNIYETTESVPVGTADGTKDVTFNAEDVNQNTNSETFTDAIIVDNTAPNVQNAQIVDNENGNGVLNQGDSYTIQTEVTDNRNVESVTTTDLSGNSISLTDGNDDNIYDNSLTLQSGVNDGSYDRTITASDGSQNTGTGTTNTIDVDNTNPSISFNAATTNTGTYQQSYINLDVSASDAHLDTVEEIFDGQRSGFSGGNYVENHTGLADGEYDFYAEASDVEGQTSSTSTRTVTLDTTAPQITNTAVSPSPAKQGEQITLSADTSDATSSIGSLKVEVFGTNYTLTQGSGTSYSTQITVPFDQNPQSYTATFYASDTVGNTGTATESVTVEQGDFNIGTHTVTRSEWGLFNYTIPQGTKLVKAELYGASGGNSFEHFGGAGGYIKGQIDSVKAGDNIIVEVGRGGSGNDNDLTTSYGGGGLEFNSNIGGGGGTHLYINPSTGGTVTSSEGFDVDDRILVAGGGGAGDADYAGQPGGGKLNRTAKVSNELDELYYGEDADYAGGGGGYYGGEDESSHSREFGGAGGSAFANFSIVENVSTTSGGASNSNDDVDVVDGQNGFDGQVILKVERTDSTSPVIENTSASFSNAQITASFDSEDPQTDIASNNITLVETNTTVQGTSATFNTPSSGYYTIRYQSTNDAGLTTTQETTVTAKLAYDEIEIDSEGNKYITEDDRLFKQSSQGNQIWEKTFENKISDLHFVEDEHIVFHDNNNIYLYKLDGTQEWNATNTGVYELDAKKDHVAYINSPTPNDPDMRLLQLTDENNLNFEIGIFGMDSAADKDNIVDLEIGQIVEYSDSNGRIFVSDEDDIRYYSYQDPENTDYIQFNNEIQPGSSLDDIKFLSYQKEQEALIAADEVSFQALAVQSNLMNDFDGEAHSGITDKGYDELYDNFGVINGNKWQRYSFELKGITDDSDFTVTKEPFEQTKNSSVNDVFVEGLNIHGVTEGTEVFEDQFFNVSESNVNITNFELSQTTRIEAGASVNATVETDGDILVESVEVDGVELQPNGTNRWRGEITVPDEEGNYTATAEVLASGDTVIDTAEQEYEVITFIPLPLVAGAILMLIATILFLVYRRRQSNEQKAARGEPI